MRLRWMLVLVMLAALVGAPRLIGGGSWSAGTTPTFAAAPTLLSVSDDDDDDGLSNDRDDEDDDDRDDDNDNRRNNDDDDDDNGGDDNDNGASDDDDDDGGSPVVGPAPSAPAPRPVCSTPGRETEFSSADGRVTVRVFGSMPQSLKFSLQMPVDAASVPPAPGPVVGGILFLLVAENCDGGAIPVLPQEVNLGVRYSDGDAAGLDEQRFTLARLDTTANTWRAAAKQATDPPANYTSATITEMGYYALHVRP